MTKLKMPTKNYINKCLATSCDKSFLIGFEVLIQSLFHNNPDFVDSGLTVIVFTDDLEESDLSRARQIYPNIELRKVDLSKFVDIQNAMRKVKSDKNISRCFSAECFSLTEYERVVFMDSDTLVVGDISYLFETKKKIAMVKEHHWESFNVGVMTIGKECISPEVTDGILALVPQLDIYNFLIQSAINKYFEGHIETLPIWYNFLKTYGDSNGSMMRKVKIIHYIIGKPWNKVEKDFKNVVYLYDDGTSANVPLENEFLDDLWLKYYKMLPSRAEISAVMLSWKRPENVAKIVESLSQNDLIGEIIIWNNNREEDLEAIRDNEKVRLVNTNHDFGLLTRWNASLLASNDTIYMQDDDLLIDNKAVEKLYDEWKKEPDVIHGIWGREPDANNEYTIQDTFGSVDMALTKGIIFKREHVTKLFGKIATITPEFRDLINKRGGDIFFNYYVRSLTGKKNKAHQLNQFAQELPDNDSLSSFAEDWMNDRTYIMRKAQEVMELDKIATIGHRGKTYHLQSLSSSDWIFTQLRTNGTFYELDLLDWLMKNWETGTYVDVGANIGNHSVFFANHCKAEKIHAIEASSEIAEILDVNCKKYGNGTIQIHNVAIGNEEGFVSLEPIDMNRVGSTKVSMEEGNIRMTTLDRLLADEEHVSIIKIDIEGMEAAAIEGAKETLQKHKPMVIAECHSADDYKACDSMLSEFGYVCQGRFGLSPTYVWKSSIIRDIKDYEDKVSSQNGEDGIINAIFNQIGVTNMNYVEFGVKDATECNTALLKQQGWNGLLMDSEATGNPDVQTEFITAENINEIFAKYEVPEEVDFMSIDIDGNDYWVWKAMDDKYKPRVLAIEYNANISPYEDKTIKYDPNFQWQNTTYYGASLKALQRLGKEKGYTLVGCDSWGINAFFVRDDLVEGNFVISDLVDMYQPFRHGHQGHTFDRRMLDDSCWEIFNG